MENNKDLFHKLVDEAKQIKLTERERNSLFLAVDTFVEKNPMKKAGLGAGSVGSEPIKSPFFKKDWLFVFSHASHNYYLASALVILAIFGTGTSFAAQGSLPGEILYPVKVNILEEVKAVFLPAALKSEYEIERTQTRIKEVKKLAEQNKLSDEIKVSVAAQINDHISAVNKDISDLNKKGDIKNVLAISTSLESALDESQDQIETIAQTDDTGGVDFVKDIIEDKKEDVVNVREVIEDQIYTKNSNDENTLEIAKAKFDETRKSIASIEKKLAKIDTVSEQVDIQIEPATTTSVSTLSLQSGVSTLVTNAKIAAPEEAVPTIEELVTQAQELLIQGEEKMKANEYNEAFRIFREANYLTRIIDFRLGENQDIGAELETLLEDARITDSIDDDSLKADVTRILDVKPTVE